MKIAILLLAHHKVDLLNKIILSYSKYFDIYIHMDKRSSLSEINDFPNVYIYSKYKVYWGHTSLLDATFFLLEEAQKVKYDRYCILSGQTLIVKPIPELLSFFKKNRDTEFIINYKLPWHVWNNGGIDRIERYWSILPNRLTGLLKLYYKVIYHLIRLLYLSPIKTVFKRRLELEFYGGSHYMHLTHSAVSFIIQFCHENPKFRKRFNYTKFSDELFFQTLLCNSPYKNSLKNENLMFIDWNSGPEVVRIFRKEDIDRINNSSALFALKFDETIDKEIIDYYLKMQN